jgi:hypothetical protein
MYFNEWIEKIYQNTNKISYCFGFLLSFFLWPHLYSLTLFKQSLLLMLKSCLKFTLVPPGLFQNNS